ncbi:MAG: hypothetical protein BWY85_02070 [Firmicutes bacterium ADurb.Bin506]|nr:MAG: hypothetical protein BWY85_02070 [Firmicutes bacterium ADurb.Bin506]
MKLTYLAVLLLVRFSPIRFTGSFAAALAVS